MHFLSTTYFHDRQPAALKAPFIIFCHILFFGSTNSHFGNQLFLSCRLHTSIVLVPASYLNLKQFSMLYRVLLSHFLTIFR